MDALPVRAAASAPQDGFFHDLFEHANDVIYTTDLSGVITAINRAGEQLTGYAREELVGSSLALLVAPESLADAMRMMDPESAGGASPTYELQIVTKDERRLVVEVRSRLLERDGRPIGIHAIARDVTRTMRTTDEARRRAARTEALNDVIAAADASPDLPKVIEIALDRALAVFGESAGGIWAGRYSAVRGLPAGFGPEVLAALRGACYAMGESLTVEDWAREFEGAATAPLWRRLGVRASLLVPLSLDDGRTGVLIVTSPGPRPWAADDVTFAVEVGRQVGATAQGLRLFREARQRVELMERLVALNEVLHRSMSVSIVLGEIGAAALRLSGADRAAVYLRAPDGTSTCAWKHGLSAEYVDRVLNPEITRAWIERIGGVAPARVDLPDGRPVAVAGPFLISDATMLDPDDIVRRLAETEGYRAIAAWPLAYEGRVIASISCYFDTPHAWSEPERETFQTFTWQAAAAVENARLFEAQRERTAELESLSELSGLLRAAPAPEDMYPVIVDHAARMLRAPHAVLALLAPDGLTFTTVGGAGVFTPGVGFPAAGSLSGDVLMTGTSFNTRDLSAGEIPGVLRLPRSGAVQLGPVAVIAVHSELEPLGTLCVARAAGADVPPFTDADLRLLQGIGEIAGTAIRRAKLHDYLEQSYIQIVLALARAMDARDAYTADHSSRLADWAEAVARRMGCGADEVVDVRWAALLHDIGKIGVPDGILLKPGPLSDEEWRAMRQHPAIGERILSPLERMRRVATIVRHHQERWDGSGYPDHLRGNAIVLPARILAVVDTYSAIVDDRPYKSGRSHEEAMAELNRCAGTKFDPAVIAAFAEVLDGRRAAGGAPRESLASA